MVSKQEVETLSEFEAKVDAAKMEAVESGNDDGEPIWVETSEQICKYFNRKAGMGPSGYFHYRGVQVCPHGKSEEIKTRLARQIGELAHGDAHVNQISATKAKTAAAT